MLKQDHYALLGVPREADTETIERACAGALSVTSDSAERARLRHARDTLCSPERRAAYDRSLRTIPTPPKGIGGAPTKAAPKPEASPTNQRWLWLGGLVVLVLIAGGLSYVYLFAKPKADTAPTADNAPATAKPGANNAKRAGNGSADARRPTAASNASAGINIDPATVYANAAPSVLAIESLNTSGAVANRGSAVVVGHELIVTHCHTVQYAAAVRVRSGSSEYTAMQDTVDSTLDLCLLRVPGLTAPAALRGSVKQVQVGQAVFAMGASQVQTRAVNQGQVSALREAADTTLIQISVSIAPSASGGGLFDAEGRLIGITAYQHKLGPSQNLALPVDLLSSLRNR